MTPPSDTTYPKTGLWKDYFDRACVKSMAAAIGNVYPRFETKQFVTSVVDKTFLTLELKQRIWRIANQLHVFLPARYDRAVALLIKVAPALAEFENWVLTTYIERYGLNHVDRSLDALKRMTEHGTGEFAIRPFIIAEPERLLKLLHTWTDDPNPHVRRLAAEGSRPRGVWVAHVEAFKKNPRPVLNLLEKLNRDESLYVRKAVANNLNDIAKDHPKLIIKTGHVWLKNKHRHTAWIVKHGCRTLIKQGHDGVFALLGFTAQPNLEVRFTCSPKRPKIGSRLTLQGTLISKSAKTQSLVIDYRVHYARPNGRVSIKTFKLAERILPAGGSVDLQHHHSFADLTTRQHHPGEHQIDLLINGKAVATTSFPLHP